MIDRAARRVLVRDSDIAFSQKEYALLVKLAGDPDRVFTREHLLRDVWGYPGFAPTRTLESHASRVRCKLEAPASTAGSSTCGAWATSSGRRPDVTCPG